MFRVKTRRVKRASSPLPVIPPSPLHSSSAITDISGSVPPMDISGALLAAPAPTTLMGRLTNFFEAESHAASTTKPWLRLERGLRLQKLRTFAESYPGLSVEEKENLNKALVKANDSKLLNTKQQLVYEEGKILNIRGLKIIRDGDPTHSASFKIEVHRLTKKRGTSDP
uniref:Uncharacterized protein n=1 Tax=viral metagenome TaxID=1070528 RepID=A0A6C0LQD8_9ZZZZ